MAEYRQNAFTGIGLTLCAVSGPTVGGWLIAVLTADAKAHRHFWHWWIVVLIVVFGIGLCMAVIVATNSRFVPGNREIREAEHSKQRMQATKSYSRLRDYMVRAVGAGAEYRASTQQEVGDLLETQLILTEKWWDMVMIMTSEEAELDLFPPSVCKFGGRPADAKSALVFIDARLAALAEAVKEIDRRCS